MRRARLSSHADEMLHERQIREEWVWWVLDFPDSLEVGDDDNTHYMKAIPERGGRVLRIVVNENVDPNRIVTVFFDRRLTREWQQ